MKRLISLLLVLLILSGFFGTYAFADNSGITWDYDTKTDTLVIKGKGPMEDFSDIEEAPWSHLMFECEKLIVEEGVESIGENAFFGFIALESVVLADSVESLGDTCFCTCVSLNSVQFPPRLIEIGLGAFTLCGELEQLDLPSSLRKIGSGAFASCTSLESVILPEGLEVLSSDAFVMCDNLSDIYVPGSVKKLDSAELLNSDSLKNLLYGGSSEEFDAMIKPIEEEFYGSLDVYTGVPYYSAVEVLSEYYIGEVGDMDVHVYTEEDSPIEILYLVDNACWVLRFNKNLNSIDYFEYVPNFTVMPVQSGEYGCWVLPATLADCVSFEMGSTVTLEDRVDEQRIWRALAGYYKDGNLRWSVGDECNVESGKTVACSWQGEVDLYAVMLAPLNNEGTEFYSEKGYMSSFEPESFLLVTSRIEAARNYLRALGLEEYLIS